MIILIQEPFISEKSHQYFGMEVKMTKQIYIMLGLVLILPISIEAQIPRVLSYQGVLSDSSGAVREDGTYSFTFNLYESQDGG